MVAFKLATLLAVATAVAAYPGGLLTRSGTCSTGTLQCCDTIQPSSSNNFANSDGSILPIIGQGLNVPVGLSCNPISVIGAGTSGSCSSQAACCEKTDGAVGINCVPVALPI